MAARHRGAGAALVAGGAVVQGLVAWSVMTPRCVTGTRVCARPPALNCPARLEQSAFPRETSPTSRVVWRAEPIPHRRPHLIEGSHGPTGGARPLRAGVERGHCDAPDLGARIGPRLPARATRRARGVRRAAARQQQYGNCLARGNKLTASPRNRRLSMLQPPSFGRICRALTKRAAGPPALPRAPERRPHGQDAPF